MTVRRLTTFALAGALGLTSLVGAAGAAQADPVDYVQIQLVDLYCSDESEGDHDEAYLNIAANGGKAVKLWPANTSYQTMAPATAAPWTGATATRCWSSARPSPARSRCGTTTAPAATTGSAR